MIMRYFDLAELLCDLGNGHRHRPPIVGEDRYLDLIRILAGPHPCHAERVMDLSRKVLFLLTGGVIQSVPLWNCNPT